MFPRMLTPPILIAAAVGVPYVATNGPSIDKLWNKGAATQTVSENNAEARAGGATNHAGLKSGARLATVPLQDALRMDVSKEWVYQRWDRKSTALSELGLYGVRVALVTGTQLYDLAGSLTYYFDQNGRVQRLSFRGRTGDTSQLVRVAQHYGLQRQPTPIVGQQLFQVRRDEQVFSELRTRPESILRTSSLHESFIVTLDLQRPDATTPLPTQPPPALAASTPQPPAAQPNPNAEQAAAAAEETKAEEKAAGIERMKAFFPRSRVPAGQVESLERRDRFW